MKHYLAKLSRLALLVILFTAKSTFAYAVLPTQVQVVNDSRTKSSLDNDTLGKTAIARLQNETIDSYPSQAFKSRASNIP